MSRLKDTLSPARALSGMSATRRKRMWERAGGFQLVRISEFVQAEERLAKIGDGEGLGVGFAGLGVGGDAVLEEGDGVPGFCRAGWAGESGGVGALGEGQFIALRVALSLLRECLGP